MKWLYPEWFLPAALLIGVVEVVVALVACSVSKRIAVLLLGLLACQILSAVFVLWANATLPPQVTGDLGGSFPALGFLEPMIVFVLFWATILALAISIPVTVYFVIRKHRRASNDA